MRLILAVLLCLLPLAALAQTQARTDEHSFMKKLFFDIQPRSFIENREICGYLGYNRDGDLRTTDINFGTEASCDLPPIPDKLRVVASFHTHSTYSPHFRSEFPTVQDLRSDAYFEINGYISTPGGRMWYHDNVKETATQLCELDCLPQDPNFRVEPGDPLRSVYTRRQLQKIEGS